MAKLCKHCGRLEDEHYGLESLVTAPSGAIYVRCVAGYSPDNNIPYNECDHGITFDIEKTMDLSANEVRILYPRLFGKCPKGCGYDGIAYASMEHYVSGDW